MRKGYIESLLDRKTAKQEAMLEAFKEGYKKGYLDGRMSKSEEELEFIDNTPRKEVDN